MISKREIKLAKKIFHLNDWDITVTIDKNSDNGDYGQAEVKREYRIAHITIYSKVIDKDPTGKETIKSTFYHEMGEIIADMYLDVLDLVESDTKTYKFCDYIADHIARVVLALTSE